MDLTTLHASSAANFTPVDRTLRAIVHVVLDVCQIVAARRFRRPVVTSATLCTYTVQVPGDPAPHIYLESVGMVCAVVGRTPSEALAHALSVALKQLDLLGEPADQAIGTWARAEATRLEVVLHDVPTHGAVRTWDDFVEAFGGSVCGVRPDPVYSGSQPFQR